MIFDKTDIQHFMDYGVVPQGHCWHLVTDIFEIKHSFNTAYHYDLFRSTYNAISFANSLGYEFFTYVEGDCVMKDFDKLIEIKNQMYQENKKLFFGKIKMEDSYYDYCTLLYGGIPSYYIEKNDMPYDVEDWVKKEVLTQFNELYYYTNINLEIIMYICFVRYLDDILEFDFNNSLMIDVLEYNRIRKATDFGLHNLYYFDDDNPNVVQVIIHNNTGTVQTKIYLDDELFLVADLGESFWSWKTTDVNHILNKKSKLEIYRNGELVETYIKDLTPEYISYMRAMHKFSRR